MERYGAAIEFDLFERGFDLAKMWQGRRFRFLLNIIDQLPAHSRYAEAMSQDDDAAEFLLSQGMPSTAEQSRLADWSPEVVELRRIVDRMGLLISYAAVGSHNKPPKLQAPPRPETALQRASRKAAVTKHRELVAALIPDSPTLAEGV